VPIKSRLTLNNSGKDSVRRSGFPLANDTNTAEHATRAAQSSGPRFFQKEEPSKGRNYKINSADKKPLTFREINAERDRRFAEYTKALKSKLPVGKKGAKRSAESDSGSGKRVRAAACHCDISRRTPEPPPPVHPLPRSVRAVFFKRGVMIKGKPAPNSTGGGKRGDVTEFSTRSRIRCAWAFLNAETDWQAMVTLTYPEMPDVETCRHQLRTWLKRVERAFPGQIDTGWCIEATKEGRPHFHVFFGSGGTMGRAISRERCESIMRRGKKYRIMRGKVEQVLVSSWLAVLDASGLSFDRDACERFQWGGICERLNSPDAAARYVSKEASKRAQKGQSLGKGCFWRLSRHLKGKPLFMSSISRDGRNVLPCYSRIFDREAVRLLADCKNIRSVQR
jgi:hypothetical protein